MAPLCSASDRDISAGYWRGKVKLSSELVQYCKYFVLSLVIKRDYLKYED